jgi:thymidine kinase
MPSDIFSIQPNRAHHHLHPHAQQPFAGPSGAAATGQIEVVCGSMFSGKSEELIRRVTRALIARQQVRVFKPALDDRYHSHHVASHAGRSAEAQAVASSGEARQHLGLMAQPTLFEPGQARLFAEHQPASPLPQVVAFDEAQFFDPGLVDLVVGLAHLGVRVIVAGLDLDFRGEPFGVMPDLLARAEHVEKLSAICVCCGAPATRTQRLVDGRAAHYDDPVILVGAAESYEPRCRACHEVPR